MHAILSEIVFDTAYLFIIICTFIALIFALGLIFAPKTTLKFNDRINTRILLREKTTPLEITIKSEPYFYKYSTINGSALVAGSLYVLYTLATINLDPLIPYLPDKISLAVWGWLIQAGYLFFLISSSFILIFGLVVIMRPSQLKKFETKANHWISTKQNFNIMSNNINIANSLVSTYPRIFGFFTLIFSTTILFLLLPML